MSPNTQLAGRVMTEWSSHPTAGLATAALFAVPALAFVPMGLRRRAELPLPTDRFTRNTWPAIQLGFGLALLSLGSASIAATALSLAERRGVALLCWYVGLMCAGRAPIPPQAWRLIQRLRRRTSFDEWGNLAPLRDLRALGSPSDADPPGPHQPPAPSPEEEQRAALDRAELMLLPPPPLDLLHDRYEALPTADLFRSAGRAQEDDGLDVEGLGGVPDDLEPAAPHPVDPAP